MIHEEARKIADIASTADGGCPACVRDLCNQLQETFPEYIWEYIEYEGIQVSLKESVDALPSL